MAQVSANPHTWRKKPLDAYVTMETHDLCFDLHLVVQL
jgi:hypothetical protein